MLDEMPGQENAQTGALEQQAHRTWNLTTHGMKLGIAQFHMYLHLSEPYTNALPFLFPFAAGGFMRLQGKVTWPHAR